MTHVSHSIRMVLGGTINSAQTWSTSFWFEYSNGSAPIPSAEDTADGLAHSDDLDGFVDAWWTIINPMTGVHVPLTSVKYYVYGEDPAVPVLGQRQSVIPNPSTVGSALPPEVAVVASLLTSKPGASFRGRVYLPLIALTTTGLGMLDPAKATIIADATAALLTSINQHDFAPSGSVWKAHLNSAVFSNTKSVMTRINRVVVDTRFDSQRRREHKLPGVPLQSTVSD